MSTKVILCTLLVLCYSTVTKSQCISANDIQVNETSVAEAVRSIIDGSTSFSLQMLRVLNNEQQFNYETNGLFFSPFSIWSALMVTYMGARGPTEYELRAVLGLGNTDRLTAWETYRNVRDWNAYPGQQVQDNGQSYRLANRVFFQEGTTFRECMRELIESDIAFTNFENQPEVAREAINAWVEAQTEQKIQDLIPSGAINTLTRMVIANAVYFKESWLQQFDPEQTRRRRFMLPSRREMFVDMMNIRGRFLYGISEDLKCTALEMPYTGNELSMVILLPSNKFYGLDILSSLLTPEKLRNLLSEMYPREVLVSIPKFHIEDSFELSSALNKMGMRTLFDPSRVDLSGFTGRREFTVDGVHHKSFIDVNEEGTEAAAATAVLASRTARPLGPAAFIADHPFMFFIQDNLSNVILFMGTVRKPSEATKK